MRCSDLLGARQAGQYLGLGSTTLNQLMAAGRIRYVQYTPGGKRWVEQSALDEFIEASRMGGWSSETQPTRKRSITKRRAGRMHSPKGPGSIRQRERKNADGSVYYYYEGRISLGKDSKGQRIQRTVTGTSEAEVAAELTKIDRRPKTNLDAENLTLETYLTEWLDEVKANKSLNTWRAWEAVVRPHIIPHIGAIRLVDVSPDHIRRLLQRLRGAGVGGRTLQLVRSTLHCALSTALKLELIHRNAAALVDTPKHKKRAVHILTVDEAKQLLEKSKGTPYYALFCLAITLGARQGELFALRWRDVNLDEGYLSINATLTADADGNLVPTPPKTKTSVRRVPLSCEAARALRELKERDQPKEPDSYVFHAAEGGPIIKTNFIRRVFHPLLVAAELPMITFHSLRHVCVSLLLASGQNEKVIAGLVGHASTRLTMDVYAHLPPAGLQSTASAMDQMLAKKPAREGTFEGTRNVLPFPSEAERARKVKRQLGLKKHGRSRVRTYDPSRVKRVLYR